MRRRPRFLRSIRGRLLASYLLLSVIPLAALGGYLIASVNHFYLHQVQTYMTSEAVILADSLADTLAGGSTVEALFFQNSPPLALRTWPLVTAFDTAGRVVLTSDPSLAGHIGERVIEPGVEGALAGQAASGVENSPATTTLVAYVAQPVRNSGRLVGAVHIKYSLAEVRLAQGQLRLAIVGVALAGAGFALLLGLWLTRAITRPIQQLSDAADAIAAGRISAPVPEATLAELDNLARQFNRMAAALAEAEAARQSAFANIAHDIRTPMGSIRSATEALAAGAVEQPELRQRLLAGLVNQSQYIGRLADDLLRLAAYEGGLTLQPARVDLGALACTAVEAVTARAAQQAVAVECCMPAAALLVDADADRMLEVLFNLLDNALTYSPTGGTVRVSGEVNARDRAARIHVRDDGPGIPPEALAHLFERHWRGDYRRTAGSAHFGLGLNIARAIILAHGGALAAANRDGGGADFFFTLPLAA
ncbi:MAG: HAMP domain-containing histidine kinase [Anaerolineales bacterium]|nr:HAMP domain-containing histidine kinase [Anaerolineales bacterium]